MLETTTSWVRRPSLCWVGLGLIACGACSRPGSLLPPIDPIAAADKAMKLLDANADGRIDEGELGAAPGLQASLKNVDVDADQAVSRDELITRLTAYRDADFPFENVVCLVTLRGQPMVGASVTLAPEPFLEDYLSGAEGTVSETAECFPQVLGADAGPVGYGMYRVRIEATGAAVPEKYNSATQLGVEVYDRPVGRGNEHVPHFNLML